MKVLLVGSGGREHAIAWKLAQSPLLERLYIAPGNAGTASLGVNVPIQPDDMDGLVGYASSAGIDLVIPGPEIPLALGLVDALHKSGIPAFGPTRAAARLESSKAFAKAFMERWHIPSARFAAFDDLDQALVYLQECPYPLVVKASGLAGGKGVVVPSSREEAEKALYDFLVYAKLGAAGRQVVLEERLEGEEISLLAFCDGKTLRCMPAAQDHKRLLDGDRGPNTGGMGAYAPAPACTAQLEEEILRTILQPAVEGMRQEGTPFTGVLYAGLMLTAAGPRLLEFNCRFGDPETQVLLPLLDSDLLEIAGAAAEGRLNELEPHWKPASAACVVLASEGYPAEARSGRVITGLELDQEQAIFFHAGTRQENGQVFTHGGRVLCITGVDENLPMALQSAYAAVQKIHFDGMQYRKDIGWRALKR